MRLRMLLSGLAIAVTLIQAPARAAVPVPPLTGEYPLADPCNYNRESECL